MTWCQALWLLWLSVGAQNAPNLTEICAYPRPCSQFLGDSSLCVNLDYVRIYDFTAAEDLCALATPAHGFNLDFIISAGLANTSRCIFDWKGDGRCDLSNNHDSENCQFDGGDCCLSTCQTNCAEEPDLYERPPAVRVGNECEYFCGEEALYWCLDDEAVLSPVRQWCAFGQIKSTSRCYMSKLEVAGALQQCMLDDRVHGNSINAGPQCGNQTLTCTLQDVEAQNGCHLTKDDCFTRMCCTEAIDNGFITANPETNMLPSIAAIYDLCETSTTDNDEPCFPYMMNCIQEARAAKGGCCSCDTGWGGWRCRDPLCWPRCVHGTCIAPDLCHCEAGWKGEACQHAICTPECVPGQGTCVLPDVCECFYGWGGTSCEVPVSEPACVNGDAVSPDICRCAEGWGGRLCDYPLCQSWPVPSPECVHGTCIKPFECECEPGWKPYLPINQTGFDIIPFWSRGQDVSQETAGTYVKADSRLSFLSFWDRQYNSSNAAQCTVPECSVVIDPRCLECEPPPNGRCLRCEPGFFVDTAIDRCERCSNVFPHCQLCGPEPTGPDGKVVLRCTHCDPLFVLEPVAFGEDPTARCVSDGPIEFSSPVYHVYKDQGNVTLVVQRSIYALRPEFARPITVIVRTRDGTAKSSSMMYGGEFASYEATVANVTFGVDESVMIPVEGSMASNFSEALTARFHERIELPILIFDDVVYHPEYRYFDVELVLPPEYLIGHQGPLYPFVPTRQHETEQAWMMPQNVYRAPVLDRQDVLSIARIYIWDHVEATAINTWCQGDCRQWQSKTLVGDARNVLIQARTFDDQPITPPTSIRPDPHFIIKYLPRGEGNEESVGTITTATPTNLVGTYAGRFIPTLAGIYKLQIEKPVAGMFAEYWWHRNIHRNSPQQPDISRVDHTLNFWFPDVATAPAFVRWKFILHFACIRTERWPFNFGHALGIIASPGSEVRAFFWNDGSVTKRIPDDVVPRKREEMIREDCMQEVPFFICIDLLFHDPVVDPFGFYAFEIEWSTPMVDDMEEKKHTSIEIMLYHQNDTDYWGWWPIKQGCLLSSGLNIQGSPFEDFQAISGNARPDFSTVLALPYNTLTMSVIVDSPAEVRIDLRDILGQPVVGGGMLRSLSARLYTLQGVKEMDLPVRWSAQGYYSAAWTPLPPDPIYNDDVSTGRYYRQLIVLLDGSQIQNSPMSVEILLAVSDEDRSFVEAGDYTPAQAGEPVWFQLRSATLAGRLRVTGGDNYEVYFEGPLHDPLGVEDQFRGNVIDNFNGSYTVRFEIQRPGLYNMRIFLNGVEIRESRLVGSPYKGILIWDDISAALSTAIGPGISPVGSPTSPAQIIAGVNTTFEISAKDSYEVQYFEGGATFTLSSPAMHQAPALNETYSAHVPAEDYIDIFDNGDGSYTVDYLLCKAGLTTMDIRLKVQEAGVETWEPIQGSPFLIEVLRGELRPYTSKVHPPMAPQSGVPATIRLDLRDACGNEADEDAMKSLQIQLLRTEGGAVEALTYEAVRSGPGEVIVFFTPGRRGHHQILAMREGEHFQASPLSFQVSPAAVAPRGSEWQLAAIGASAASTFEIFDSPTFAGEPGMVKVTARDLWGDVLTHENHSFIISFWRDTGGHGECPSLARCMAAAISQEMCERLPLCHFEPVLRQCRPNCHVSEAMVPYRLVMPDALVTQTSVHAEVYEFSLQTTVAGTYHGAVSVLRPGAFYAYWYNNPQRSKRVFSEMMRGPLDMDWGIFGPGGTLPGNKYYLQIIGWLRVPATDKYVFQLTSDTGGYSRVFLNGSEITPSDGDPRMEVDLLRGFIPIEILYDHWMGETTRNVGAFLKLGFGGPTVPFQTLQANFMYYEEVLHQANNPFVHVVEPAIPVRSLQAVGGVRGSVPVQAMAARDVFFRLQSADFYGNLQTRRDPASSLRLREDELGLVKRIVPLHSGAWDVVLVPRGPVGRHRLTFDVFSQASRHGSLQPVANYSVEVDLVPNLPDADLTTLLCLPPAPWPVGVEVTCALIPRDSEGNQVPGLQQVHLFAQPPPPFSEELTASLHVADPKDVARQFRFFPTVAGMWTLRGEAILAEDRVVNFRTWPFEVLGGQTSAYRSYSVQPSRIITGIPFNVPIYAFDEYDNPSEAGMDIFRLKTTGGYEERLALQPSVQYLENNTYMASNLVAEFRDLFEIHIDQLAMLHNNSLSQCPELSPVPGGQIFELSEKRAIGSVAHLRCLSGFIAAGGEGALRCLWPNASASRQVVGYAEWFNLSSMPASGLMCREQLLWCPMPPSVPFGQRVALDWRRQVGSIAMSECLQGHMLLFGDLDVVCGSRGGLGTWLRADGTTATAAACMPIQQLCPELSPPSSDVVAASDGRNAGSVIQLRCKVGLVPAAGDAVLVCGSDGMWLKPLQTRPQPLGEVLSCEPDPYFCSDPSLLLGPGAVVQQSDTHLNDTVSVTCSIGFEEAGDGEATGKCAIDPEDDSKGRWASPTDVTKGQVPWRPLRCRRRQSYCGNIEVDHGQLLSLSDERYLGSAALLGCAEGYEAKSGDANFLCTASTIGAGEWLSQSGAGLSQKLSCGKVSDYCPQPVPPEGTDFVLSVGRELDSVLTFQCHLAYESNVALEYPPELFCRPAPVPGRGQWSSRDGKGLEPAQYLKCGKQYNWCPRLSLVDGRVSNVLDNRQLGSTAQLRCDSGLQMTFGSSDLGLVTLDVNCTSGTPAGGVWMATDGQDIAGQLQCTPLDYWCPPLTGYTIVTATYRELDPFERYVTYSSTTRAYRSTATIRCAADKRMLDSYGDSEVVCGLDAEGIGGAWRSSQGGHLAISKHCFYTGSPITDTAFIENGCFFGDFAGSLDNYSIPVYFFRTGAVIFWHQPTEWVVGSTVLEGQNSNWQLKWIGEGILNARVDRGVGELQIDVTQNFTKGPGDWFHIAFIWDLGVGLAGQGRSYLWVDGIEGQPVSPNSERLNHFIWVEPQDGLDLGGIRSPMSPGEYSNIRVYTRALTGEQVYEIFSQEDPTCGMTDDVCPTPWSFRSYVHEVTNPNDFRYKLFPRRPAAEVFFKCDPGYTAFDGDSHIICTSAGTWLKYGTNQLAQPLRCCRHAENFCPTIDLTGSAGAVLTATGYEILTECGEMPVDDGLPQPVVSFARCSDPPTAAQVVVELSDDLNISSIASLRCDHGFEPLDPFTMDTELRCVRGTVPDPLLSDVVVPSRWMTIDGREPRPLHCRGVQNFCPDPRLPNTTVIMLSDSLRTGSIVHLRCLDGFAGPVVEATCERSPDDSLGMWVTEDNGTQPLTSLDPCMYLPQNHSEEEPEELLVPGAVWNWEGCAQGEGSAMLSTPSVPLQASGGTVSLWWQLPAELEERYVLWASMETSCLQAFNDTNATESVSGLPDDDDTTATTTSSYLSLGEQNDTNMSNISLEGVMDPEDGNDYDDDESVNQSNASNETLNLTLDEVNSSERNQTRQGLDSDAELDSDNSTDNDSESEDGENISWREPNHTLFVDVNNTTDDIDSASTINATSEDNTTSNDTNESESGDELNDSNQTLPNSTAQSALQENVSLPMSEEEMELNESDGNTSDDSENSTDEAANANESNSSDEEQVNVSNATIDVPEIDGGSEALPQCLESPHMVVTRGILQVQLSQGLGDFSVDLVRLGLRSGQWLHLSYAWNDGGMETRLWLNGTNVLASETTTTSTNLLDVAENLTNMTEAEVDMDELNENETYTSEAESNESEDNVSYDSENVTTKPVEESNNSNESESEEAAGEDTEEWLEVLEEARHKGWITVPAEANYNLTLADDLDFQLVMGWPLDSTEFLEHIANNGWRTLYRLYDKLLQDSDAEQLSHERPYCPVVLCPRPDEGRLQNSHIRHFPRRAVPGEMLRLACSPGYYATAGQEELHCAASGEFMGMALECCSLDPEFCPEVPSRWRQSLHSAPEDMENLIVEVYEPSDPCEGEENGTAQSLGAELHLHCPAGYVLVAGTRHAICAQKDDEEGMRPSLGMWKDLEIGGELRLPVCDLDDNWCPMLYPGYQSFIVNATAGRRLGSLAFLRCLDDQQFEPDFGSVTLRCGMASDRQSGQWVDAFDAPATALSCRQRIFATTSTTTLSLLPTSSGVISGLPGDQGLDAFRHHAANASLGCGYPFVNVGGDTRVYCVLGPSTSSPDGTEGRWVDQDGSNIELPICVLRRDWCPQIDLVGKNSEALLSSAYEFGSVATLRCHIGYQRVDGNITLNCINHESLLYGIWDAEPVRCELSPFFCPAPEATFAGLVQLESRFQRGDVVNMACHAGYSYLQGDLEVYCDVGDNSDGGQWKTSDGTAAKPVVCVPQQDFCTLPMVNNGYVNSVSEEGKMGSIVELQCQDGFTDLRLDAQQRTARCTEGGAFQVGISRVSRDLLRATSLAQDVLDELESYWALDTRESDLNWRALMQFEYRWRSELSLGLRGLLYDSAVREVLVQFPDYDGGLTDKWMAMFTVDDVRRLVTLLEEQHGKMLDLAHQNGLPTGLQEEPILYCNRTPDWCPLPELPEHSSFVAGTGVSARALGDQVFLECHPHYVYDLGLQSLMCGNDGDGSAIWRAVDGRQAQPNITCSLNRLWCPPLPSLHNSHISSMEPHDRSVYTEVRLECRRGYYPTAGHAFGRCAESGQWCSSDGPSAHCAEPADWLRCELIPAYCPSWPGKEETGPYGNGNSRFLGNEHARSDLDPLAHVFLREVRQLPLPSAALGDTVTLSCPQYFSRATGDLRFKCGHGRNGTGEWQREAIVATSYLDNSTPDALIQLVDEAIAEPLACELQTQFGVRRKYYERLPGLFRNHSRSGEDVVPHINQIQSPYDASHFDAYLRPQIPGNYTLCIEVVGSFVLTFDKEILLSARSQGLLPELFVSKSVTLDASRFHSFSLEYWADPLLPERVDSAMNFQRHLRFLWNTSSDPPLPVPYSELFHSFDTMYGSPNSHLGINDPEPCPSGSIQYVRGLNEYEAGWVTDGSLGFNYNPDSQCQWELEAVGNVRFTVFSNFVDLVDTQDCAGDRLEFHVGSGNALRLLGAVCGSYPEGTPLVQTSSRRLVIRFVTDGFGEREGFNVTYNLTRTNEIIAENTVIPRVS
ncbi:wif1 [Symbiodinium sp. CCMP2592]|nr:wif1 [Symbiodinium sp. CCMP2592]